MTRGLFRSIDATAAELVLGLSQDLGACGLSTSVVRVDVIDVAHDQSVTSGEIPRARVAILADGGREHEDVAR